MYLNDSYKKCNPGFGYTSNLNPRRSLTKPSEPAGNDGHDNENSDLIISVNDILVSDDGTSGEYEVRDVLGSGTFGQVFRCRQKGTGKAADIKITGASTLSEDEVEKMVKDAEAAKAKVRAKVSTDTHSANLALNGCVPRILAHSSAFLPR